MPAQLTAAFRKPPHHLRAATMMGLRWLAVGGQLLAVLVTRFGLGFMLPLLPCLVVISASVILNVALRLKVPLAHRFEDRAATMLLAYDVVQLTLLLYLTGGLGNPFSMLFLGPLMISAVSLSPSRTLLLGLLTGAAATLLVRVHLPLPWMPGQHLELPPVFSLGTWMAVVIGAGFVGIYASRVAEEARQLSEALAATELVLAREQHLTQLDGLAAAAAHELGTPLATITLVVKELLRGVQKPTEIDPQAMRDDLALLDQEANRCRVILSKLTSLNDEKAGPMEEMALAHLIEDVVSPYRHFGVALSAVRKGQGEEPVAARNPGILYGLGNLVENAIDYARSAVTIESWWDEAVVRVVIADDGPGFSSDVIARLGEPYLSSRNQDRRAKGEEGGAGLGLGLFIAKTLLERSGAKLDMHNAALPDTGAIVTIEWPRDAFEHDRAPPVAQSRKARLQALQGL